MSDAWWPDTRASFRRLREALKAADEGTRWDLGFLAAGLVMMAAAIAMEFGWHGSLFCSGFLIWWSANSKFRSS